MQNPVKSEEAAFKLVIMTIAFFVPIVATSYISSLVALLVFLLELGALAWWIVRARRSRRVG